MRTRFILFFCFVFAALLVPIATPAQQTITCESNDGGRKHCGPRNPGQVQLQRQISGSECIQDRTWGVDDRGLWVDHGCRAEFLIGGDNNYNPGYNGNGGYNDNGAAKAPPSSANPTTAIANIAATSIRDRKSRFNNKSAAHLASKAGRGVSIIAASGSIAAAALSSRQAAATAATNTVPAPDSARQ